MPRYNLTLLRRKSFSIWQRKFHNRSEYDIWTHKMTASRMKRPNDLKKMDVSIAAPFLQSVSPISDRLLIHEISTKSNRDMKEKEIVPRSPLDSMLQCTYPLSSNDSPDVWTNFLRTSVSDFGNWSSFRLSKFYADVDALTADVAYRHAGVPTIHHSHSPDTNISFVTAGHFNSRKLKQTDITKDLILRCYPTQTGNASMEIRTDAIQLVDGTEEEELVNVCYTTMVAVNTETLRPTKNVIPRICSDGDEDDRKRQKMRLEMAQQHNQIRKKRMESSMQLNHNPSYPPTAEEMKKIHSIYQHLARNSVQCQEQRNSIQRVSDHTYRSSRVVYPESRNVHGKSFGGFVVEESHAIAQYAADFFLYADQQEEASDISGFSLERPIPVGLDEAVFFQPISIGDHVTFTARVVHATPSICRVQVIVEVRNPTERDRQPLRSNSLSFLFCCAGSTKQFPEIIPHTYSEILMHMKASRRYIEEGPSDEYVARIQNTIREKKDQ